MKLNNTVRWYEILVDLGITREALDKLNSEQELSRAMFAALHHTIMTGDLVPDEGIEYLATQPIFAQPLTKVKGTYSFDEIKVVVDGVGLKGIAEIRYSERGSRAGKRRVHAG